MEKILLIDDEDIKIEFQVKNKDYLFQILEDIDKETLYEYLKDDFDKEYDSGWQDALEWKKYGSMY